MISPRPADGALPVTLYGKTADLVRDECARRQMGYDELVQQIIQCWYMDLQRARRRHQRDPLELRIGEGD